MSERLLVLSHGHPRFNRGGGEHAAYAVHEHIDALPGWQSLFLAAAPQDRLAADSDLEQLDTPQEWLLRPTGDWLLLSSAVALHEGCALHRLVQDWCPNVVHIHHVHRIGVDVVWAIARWCPAARLVITLHEFLPLCAYQGQLLTPEGALCEGASAAGCMACLPAIDGEDLWLREQLMRSLMQAMDVCIAPSRQLAEVYIRWGVEPQRLSVVDYALPSALAAVAAPVPAPPGKPCQFGVFGNVLPPKGLDLVLEAFLALGDRNCEAQLHVFGALPKATPGSFADGLQQRIERLGDRVVLHGGYSQADVPRLMEQVHWVVMASRWRENSPVVILEAKACGRPLLVPALGGMAEKVRNGLDGWHYTPGDAMALMDLIHRCSQSRQAWQHLQASLDPPACASAITQAHLRLYRGDQNFTSTEA